MRISDWSSDVCSSDLVRGGRRRALAPRDDFSAGEIARERDVSAGSRRRPSRSRSTAVASRARSALRPVARRDRARLHRRSEEYTSELQSLMRISYAVFCLKTKKQAEPKKQNSKRGIT